MTNTFHCRCEICPPCGNAAESIQRNTPRESWGDRIDQLADPVRECVREYLRGIWMRAQAIGRAKA